MAIVLLTPNWANHSSIFPTDTLRPPKSFPIEWGYTGAGSHKELVMVLDEYSERKSFHETQLALQIFSPRLVVISTTPSYLFWRCPPLNVDLICRYVRIVRFAAPRALVLIVGPHGTVDPGWSLAKTGADCAFRGEIDQFLAPLLAGGSISLLLSSAFVATIEEHGQIAPQRSFHEIGSIEYKLMCSEKYEPHAWGAAAQRYLRNLAGSAVALGETSRGCSYNCGYCFRSGFRNTFRLKPLSLVEDELRYLASRNVKYVFFIDETFGLNWPHSVSVLELLAKHGIKYGMQTRPDIWTQERISYLGQTGCVYAEIGVEANEAECQAVLNKYRDLGALSDLVSSIRAVVPFVNKNIIDMTNQDLFGVKASDCQLDNSGHAPPPFIPYPTTQFGDKVLSGYSHRGQAEWDLAESLYILYSLISQYSWIRRAANRNKRVRRLLLRFISVARVVFIPWRRSVKRSRYEKLFG